MNLENYDPNKSLVLFGLQDRLQQFIRLYDTNKLPRVTMLSGKKGIGKHTLINHFLYYIFDNKNYDIKSFKLNKNTFFFSTKNIKRFSKYYLPRGKYIQ